MTGTVARQLQNAEPDAAEVQIFVPRADDGVRREALLQKILPALAVGEGHIVGPVGVGVHGDACLDDMGGGLCAVALL